MDVGFVSDHLNQDPTVSLCVAGVMGGGELGTSWLCRKSGVLVSTIMLREVNSKLTEPFIAMHDSVAMFVINFSILSLTT